MKKTILLSSILAAGALFAEDAAPTPTEVASTEVGVMGLETPSKATLFAVPFLGYTADAITVADMVNTAELATDSKLYVPNTDGTYDVWTLGSDRKWRQTQTSVTIGNVGASESQGAAANSVQTGRGGAFWLEPAAGSEALVYLLGKPASGAGTSTAVGEKWNLVGNTSDKPVNLSGLTGANFDQIAVQVDGILRYYTYKIGKGWRYQDSEGVWVSGDDVKIQLGRGLWYKPASDTTIDWSNGMVKAVAQ